MKKKKADCYFKRYVLIFRLLDLSLKLFNHWKRKLWLKLLNIPIIEKTNENISLLEFSNNKKHYDNNHRYSHSSYYEKLTLLWLCLFVGLFEWDAGGGWLRGKVIFYPVDEIHDLFISFYVSNIYYSKFERTNLLFHFLTLI